MSRTFAFDSYPGGERPARRETHFAIVTLSYSECSGSFRGRNVTHALTLCSAVLDTPGSFDACRLWANPAKTDWADACEACSTNAGSSGRRKETRCFVWRSRGRATVETLSHLADCVGNGTVLERADRDERRGTAGARELPADYARAWGDRDRGLRDSVDLSRKGHGNECGRSGAIVARGVLGRDV